jgi:hypothetical protein
VSKKVRRPSTIASELRSADALATLGEAIPKLQDVPS